MLFGVSSAKEICSGESVRRDAREESWRARVRSHTFARQHHVAFARGEARAREETPRARREAPPPGLEPRDPSPPSRVPRVNRASRRVPCAEPPRSPTSTLTTMPDRFRAVSKLARDDPSDRGARASDTWSCARCSRRNSPAMRACETCGLDRVPAPGTRRRANMAWSVPAPRPGAGLRRPRGMDRTFPPRSLELARSPERLPRRSRPRRRRQVRRARAPPRGSSPRAGRPPEAPSRAARNRASSPTASPNEPAWRVANDPVLMETDGGDAHANQGVPREDAMMDEDGDEADDFLLAEDAPRAHPPRNRKPTSSSTSRAPTRKPYPHTPIPSTISPTISARA